MASDYGGPNRPHSTHIHHSLTVPLPQCFAQSHDLHGVIQREIEEERIRHEITVYKILTRRALEAEVRRDLVMVETFLKRGGRDGFPFESPLQMGLDLPVSLPLAEERFLDETSMLLTQRHMLNDMCEGGRSASLPFQRASIDERMGRDSMAKESEVKCVPEGSNKRNEIILEIRTSEGKDMEIKVETGLLDAKPVENITGAKRVNPGSGASAQSDANLKKQKRVNDDWSCTLCQVTATSEHTLNEHLKGKKHKTKEAASKANKSMIGLCTKNAAKPIQSSGTSNQVIEVKLTPKPWLSFGKPSSETDGPLPLQGKPNPENLNKKESVVTPQGKQKGEHKKEAYKFWCDMCQVVEKTAAEVLTAVKNSQMHNPTVELQSSSRPVRHVHDYTSICILAYQTPPFKLSVQQDPAMIFFASQNKANPPQHFDKWTVSDHFAALRLCLSLNSSWCHQTCLLRHHPGNPLPLSGNI
ncbi:hypothetical protein SASPL_112037 [Salvia splendens]|uniref:U1-type domain-containing protein n=1 Tax=Salvia splendens TaxID=180675 RepID=A0A8X8YD34_SALSN|nr:hypothetical protein SASPL_112037 [Salvia splendens]